MFSAYHKLLHTYPLHTRMLTCGLICSFADSISQNYIQKHDHFNFRRNLTLFFVGALYTAPVLHMWYSKFVPMIERHLFTQHTSKIRRVLTLVVIDQSVFSPLLITGFFIVNGFISSPSVEGLKSGIENWKHKIVETLQASWKVWPAAITVNFWFVPPAYRVLFPNIVSFFWNIILTSIAYDKKIKTQSVK